MAVALVGSPVVVDARDPSGSIDVTVPVGANAVVAVTGGWAATANALTDIFDGASLTIGGNSIAYLGGQALSVGGDAVTMFGRFGLPSSGTQAFAWDWEGGSGLTEGGRIVLCFLSGVDSTAPFSTPATAVNDSFSPNTATTASLTIASGDYVLSGAYSWVDTDTGVFGPWAASLSELYDSAGTYGIAGLMGVAGGAPSSNQTTTATLTWSVDPSMRSLAMISVVVRQSTSTVPSYLGDDPISAMYLGELPVSAIYLGSTQVY